MRTTGDPLQCGTLSSIPDTVTIHCHDVTYMDQTMQPTCAVGTCRLIAAPSNVQNVVFGNVLVIVGH